MFEEHDRSHDQGPGFPLRLRINYEVTLARLFV
jgi:hypothetical protein